MGRDHYDDASHFGSSMLDTDDVSTYSTDSEAAVAEVAGKPAKRVRPAAACSPPSSSPAAPAPLRGSKLQVSIDRTVANVKTIKSARRQTRLLSPAAAAALVIAPTTGAAAAASAKARGRTKRPAKAPDVSKYRKVVRRSRGVAAAAVADEAEAADDSHADDAGAGGAHPTRNGKLKQISFTFVFLGRDLPLALFHKVCDHLDKRCAHAHTCDL